MKNLASLAFVLLMLSFFVSQNGNAQTDQYEYDLTCKVQQVYPAISITEQELIDAETLIDLNRHFKPSWIKEYRSVEISAVIDGTVTKIKSRDNIITKEQKEMMQKADLGSKISAIIHYIPQNNLQIKEARFEDFTFTIDPNKSASYPNGEKALNQYLTDRVLNKADHSVFKPYNLSSVQFTINQEGQILNAHIVHSSENERTDKILLEAICDMPSWIPAQYTNGTKTKQDFVLTVGDMSSCTMNLLNVRHLAVEQH